MHIRFKTLMGIDRFEGVGTWDTRDDEGEGEGNRLGQQGATGCRPGGGGSAGTERLGE